MKPYEKSWSRDKAVAFDAAWGALSVEARIDYLHLIKPPAGNAAGKPVSSNLLATAIRQELMAAGLIEDVAGRGKLGQKVASTARSADFARRIHAINQARLMQTTQSGPMLRFISTHYSPHIMSRIGSILTKEQIEFGKLTAAEVVDLYVATSHWVKWVEVRTPERGAAELAARFRSAAGPIPLSEINKAGPDTPALGAFIESLVVFEDVDPRTLEIMVGILPIARRPADLAKGGAGGLRPPLEEAADPVQEVEVDGLILDDARAILIELNTLPAKIRQDQSLFAKHADRLKDRLTPWPEWLADWLDDDDDDRFDEALYFLQIFKLAEVGIKEQAGNLMVTAEGERWLGLDAEEQFRHLASRCREFREPSSPYQIAADDYAFLGTKAIVLPRKSTGQMAYFYGYEKAPKPVDRRRKVREALYDAWSGVAVGRFHTWQSVTEHVGIGPTAPLNVVLRSGEDLAVLSEHRGPAGQSPTLEQVNLNFVGEFIRNRLAGFGAVRIGVDARGRIVVARTPRFDGYFGKDYEPEAMVATETRVIVQPDFSVVVVGLDPRGTIPLLGFCDRVPAAKAIGTTQLKITRGSVYRGVKAKLDAATMLGRLKANAVTPIPENVAREIAEWSSQVRNVEFGSMHVVRCPDASTADRAMAVLGRKAERIGLDLIGWPESRLTPAEVQKLADQGLFLGKLPPKPSPQPRGKLGPPAASKAGASKAAATPKKRGRPKKQI